ncbi:MAG: MCE family protein [Flavobacteriales bacterium]|nr:MCE family protein [Flavobacteriales bacterium]
MKISKELKTGVITVAAIGLLVAGVNFLKGNSFFGGDDHYYAYFADAGQLSPASAVNLNGVTVGRVQSVIYEGGSDSTRLVKVSFNIQEDNIKMPIGSIVEITSLDLLGTKGLKLLLRSDISQGYYKDGDTLSGSVATDMIDEVKSYADPLSKKVSAALSSIDKMVNGVSAFWDTTASSSLEGSLKEVQIAIKRFGNAAEEIELLIVDEKIKLSRILANVETITLNLKKSNDKVKAIIGNVEQITSELVTSDFKGVITNAKNTLGSINATLEKANNGDGTLGKLLGDETLYNELVKTNEELQNLVNDIQVHPERYIHVSVFGAKTKGVPLTNIEEQKLHNLLDTIK